MKSTPSGYTDLLPSKPLLKPCDSLASISFDRMQDSLYTDVSALNDRGKENYCESASETALLDNWLCPEHGSKHIRCSMDHCDQGYSHYNYHQMCKDSLIKEISGFQELIQEHVAQTTPDYIHPAQSHNNNSINTSHKEQSVMRKSNYKSSLASFRSKLHEVDNEPSVVDQSPTTTAQQTQTDKAEAPQPQTLKTPSKPIQQKQKQVTECAIQTNSTRKKIFGGIEGRPRDRAVTQFSPSPNIPQGSQLIQNPIKEIHSKKTKSINSRFAIPASLISTNTTAQTTTSEISCSIINPALELKKYGILKAYRDVVDIIVILFNQQLDGATTNSTLADLRFQTMAYSKSLDSMREILPAVEQLEHQNNLKHAQIVQELGGWIICHFLDVVRQQKELNKLIEDFLVVNPLQQLIKHKIAKDTLKDLQRLRTEFETQVGRLNIGIKKVEYLNQTILRSKFVKQLRNFLQASMREIRQFIGSVKQEALEQQVKKKSGEYKLYLKNKLSTEQVSQSYKLELLKYLSQL